jgi:hypothetical protein
MSVAQIYIGKRVQETTVSFNFGAQPLEGIQTNVMNDRKWTPLLLQNETDFKQ